MATLFISDLHLCTDRPEITRLFLHFLKSDASEAEALYILGDLFEYWVGDEATEFAGMIPIIRGLRELSDSGVPLFAMHGNRDVLLRAGFEAATGARLLRDPTVVDLYGQATLISHGDYLCTDDVEYQEFRHMVRDPAWQDRFLARDLDEREAVIRTYREVSRSNTAAKSPEIMDVNPDAVRTAMRQHGVTRMIHGHTHRPAIHTFDLDGAVAQRIVLGDWYEQGSVLECTRQGCELRGVHGDSLRTAETPG